jgi:hypothetical protein
MDREGITDYIVGNDYNDIKGYYDIDSLRGIKRCFLYALSATKTLSG